MVAIKDRMISALKTHGDGGFLPYHRLAHYVFPRDLYPRAFDRPTRGGPPGCYMALSRAIRVRQFYINYEDSGGGPTVGLPSKDT